MSVRYIDRDTFQNPRFPQSKSRLAVVIGSDSGLANPDRPTFGGAGDAARMLYDDALTTLTKEVPQSERAALLSSTSRDSVHYERAAYWGKLRGMVDECGRKRALNEARRFTTDEMEKDERRDREGSGTQRRSKLENRIKGVTDTQIEALYLMARSRANLVGPVRGADGVEVPGPITAAVGERATPAAMAYIMREAVSIASGRDDFEAAEARYTGGVAVPAEVVAARAVRGTEEWKNLVQEVTAIYAETARASDVLDIGSAARDEGVGAFSVGDVYTVAALDEEARVRLTETIIGSAQSVGDIVGAKPHDATATSLMVARGRVEGMIEAHAEWSGLTPGLVAAELDRVAAGKPTAVSDLGWSIQVDQRDGVPLASDVSIIVNSPDFEAYRASMSDMLDEIRVARGLADRSAHAELAVGEARRRSGDGLDLLDVVMTTREEAKVMARIVEWAATHGPAIPSVEETRVAFDRIRASLSEPVMARVPSDALLATPQSGRIAVRIDTEESIRLIGIHGRGPEDRDGLRDAIARPEGATRAQMRLFEDLLNNAAVGIPVTVSEIRQAYPPSLGFDAGEAAAAASAREASEASEAARAQATREMRDGAARLSAAVDGARVALQEAQWRRDAENDAANAGPGGSLAPSRRAELAQAVADRGTAMGAAAERLAAYEARTAEKADSAAVRAAASVVAGAQEAAVNGVAQQTFGAVRGSREFKEFAKYVHLAVMTRAAVEPATRLDIIDRALAGGDPVARSLERAEAAALGARPEFVDADYPAYRKSMRLLAMGIAVGPEDAVPRLASAGGREDAVAALNSRLGDPEMRTLRSVYRALIVRDAPLSREQRDKVIDDAIEPTRSEYGRHPDWLAYEAGLDKAPNLYEARRGKFFLAAEGFVRRDNRPTENSVEWHVDRKVVNVVPKGPYVARTFAYDKAIFGEKSNPMDFPTVGITGARYYKNAGFVEEQVAKIAAANAAPGTPRKAVASIVTVADFYPEGDRLANATTANVIAAAQKSGMPVVYLHYERNVATAIDFKDGQKGKSWSHTDSFTFRDEAGNRVPLQSREGRRIASGADAGGGLGALIVIVPKVDAGSKSDAGREYASRMHAVMGWQTMNALSSRMIVMDDPSKKERDYHAKQVQRRAFDTRKPIEVFNENGAKVPDALARSEAALGAPKQRDDDFLEKRAANDARLNAKPAKDGEITVDTVRAYPAASDKGRQFFSRMLGPTGAARVANVAKEVRLSMNLQGPLAVDHIIKATRVSAAPEHPGVVAVLSAVNAALSGDIRESLRNRALTERALQIEVSSANALQAQSAVTTTSAARGRAEAPPPRPFGSGPMLKAGGRSLVGHFKTDAYDALLKPGIAIVGPERMSARTTKSFAGDVARTVAGAAAAGLPIVTTADDVGSLVIRAAAAVAKAQGSQPKIVIVNGDTGVMKLDPETAVLLHGMVARGAAAYVTGNMKGQDRYFVTAEQRGEHEAEKNATIKASHGRSMFATDADGAKHGAASAAERLRLLETVVASTKAVVVVGAPSNDASVIAAAQAGLDPATREFAGQAVAVLAPANMTSRPARGPADAGTVATVGLPVLMASEHRGSLDLARSGGHASLRVGTAGLLGHAKGGHIDQDTGLFEKNAPRGEGKDSLSTAPTFRSASWISPATALTHPKAIDNFVADVATGTAEPMHGKFRAGLTARDIELLTGAARHPTPDDMRDAAQDLSDDRAFAKLTGRPEAGEATATTPKLYEAAIWQTYLEERTQSASKFKQEKLESDMMR